MQYQLGIYRRDRGRDYIDLMLNGEKTVDIKLSTKRLAPYEKIKPHDILLIKESSGPLVGACQIPWVKYYDLKSTTESLFSILMEIWEPLGLRNEEHVLKMVDKTSLNRYVTVFGLSDPIIFHNPIWIEKHDMRSWIPDYKPPFELEPIIRGETNFPEDFIQ